MGRVRSWSVVVPAKRLAVAKTRLRPVTDGLADAPRRSGARPAGRHGRRRAWPARSSPRWSWSPTTPPRPSWCAGSGARTRRRRAGRRAQPRPRARRRAASPGRPSPACPRTCRRCARRELAAALAAAAGVTPRAFVADAHGTGTTLLTAVGVPLRPAVRPRLGGGAPRRAARSPLAGDWPGLRARRRHRRRPPRRAGPRRRAAHDGTPGPPAPAVTCRPAVHRMRTRVPTESSSRTARCRPTGSSTGSCPGSTSTRGCWSSPRTRQLPLLERVKFLAIFASNLDEFYMVRIAGLKRRQTHRPTVAVPRRPHHPRAARARHRSGPRTWCSGTPTCSSRTSRRGWRRPASGSCTGRTSPTTTPGGCASTSATRCSRCSRRWPSTRRTRSPTSAACR